MRRSPWSNVLWIAGLSFGINQAGLADSWFDFSQSNTAVTITATSFPDTNTLRVVKVVCPQAGYLVAQGSVQMQLTPITGNSSVQAGISITLDNTAPYAADPNHFNSIVFSTMDGTNAVTPSFLQRVDRCRAGQSVNYRFVAWAENAAPTSVAFQPVLVVQFFNLQI